MTSRSYITTPYPRSGHVSTIDQAQIRESPPAKDRRPNHWAPPPTTDRAGVQPIGRRLNPANIRLWPCGQTATRSPSLPFNGPHPRNPCNCMDCYSITNLNKVTTGSKVTSKQTAKLRTCDAEWSEQSKVYVQKAPVGQICRNLQLQVSILQYRKCDNYSQKSYRRCKNIVSYKFYLDTSDTWLYLVGCSAMHAV